MQNLICPNCNSRNCKEKIEDWSIGGRIDADPIPIKTRNCLDCNYKSCFSWPFRDFFNTEKEYLDTKANALRNFEVWASGCLISHYELDLFYRKAKSRELSEQKGSKSTGVYKSDKEES